MANESAVIIPIPAVEPIVGQLRLQFDGSARLGAPAHVTLLYPFFPAEDVWDKIRALRDACASIEAFAFSFVDVRRFPATAYLYPDQPGRFAQITRTLMKIWPELKPYGGAFSDIVPHLTVADRVDSETLAAVEDSLRPQLPVRCMAKDVWLLTSDATGVWSKTASFPLVAGAVLR